MSRLSRVGAGLLVFLLMSATLGAQPKPDEKQLTIHPAPLPMPALKYRFTAAPEDQVVGNAATAYLLGFGLAQTDRRVDDLEETPAVRLKEAGAQDFLDKQHSSLEQIRIATQRTACSWDTSFRQQGFAAHYGFLNQARWAANVLTIQARLQVADGRYDAATDTLRDGFVLADNLTHDAPSVQALVAVGIQSVMLNDTLDFVQAKDAPNLYWALANLRRPMINSPKVMEMESAALFFTFPELKDHPERLPADKTRELYSRIGSYARGTPTAGESASGLAHMMKEYPKAKDWLIRRGMSAQEVDELAANSVVLAYDVEQYRSQTQEFIKWAGIPSWRARPGLQRAAKQIEQAREEYNILTSLVPAFPRADLQFGRVDRELAMLMCVEAIRAYAATHAGALPPTLEALSPDTPVLDDPMLGRAFEYQSHGNTATLRAAAPEGEPKFLERVFQITLER